MLPIANKTWDNFKTHFTAAQKQLRAIRGPTMQQAGYHHANMIANRMEQRNEELLSVIQTALSATTKDPSSQDETALSTLTPVTQQANATTTDQVQLEILKLLQQMQQEMKPSTTAPAPAPNNRRRRVGRKTPDTASRPRNNTSKYCWTHGGCGHDGSACEDKAPGHKSEATFENRMDGSNAYCT